MQRIDLAAALAVVLEAHPMSQGQQLGEALREPLVAGDLAANVADHPAEPDAQEFELAPGALELVRVAIAPNHDRRPLGHPAITLPQLHIVALRQIDQLFQGAVAQPGIGWVGDRLWLHRGVDHHSLKISVLVVFEQGAERADVFVLELSAVVEVGAQERVLAFDPSGGDAECEPAAGEVVQCRGLFGDEQRVALGQDEIAGREADGAGVGGDPGERGEAFEQVPNGSGSLVGGSRTWSLVHSEV